MRKLLITLWLLVPLGVFAYHYAPAGQEAVVRDQAGSTLKRADRHAAAEEWEEAVAAYDEAIELIPIEEAATIREARLARAQVRMNNHQLPVAYQELTELANEAAQDETIPEEFTNEVRDSLANSQYYLTWLMRLEGLPREIWEPEINAARQNYRLLAEAASTTGNDMLAKRHREDLDATVRLANLDLDELQGLPLPSQ